MLAKSSFSFLSQRPWNKLQTAKRRIYKRKKNVVVMLSLLLLLLSFFMLASLWLFCPTEFQTCCLLLCPIISMFWIMCYDKTLKDITTSLQNDSVSKRLVSMLSLFFGVLFFPFIRSTKSCPSSINTIRCITLRHTLKMSWYTLCPLLYLLLCLWLKISWALCWKMRTMMMLTFLKKMYISLK